MSKNALSIVIVSIVLVLIFIFTFDAKSKAGDSSSTQSVQNVEVKNGVQYITINAKGGYSPRVSSAKAGIPTKIIIKTKDTYDCSALLVVRSAKFQKILPQSGETEIDLGTPKAGEPVQGVCGMGMYSFVVEFS
ncbi:MAG: hypothetical protein UU24_C0019G0008 [Candidatus Nomurabacteria bacterium GW2011_GWA2_40_9]|uniref:EfeO-type cupredoxin-like domain-containing protein n=1 Tax=Candidatus Nomurabacteria bacterium GW2011_GWA2_40_9 TaxID=1618734 RepID=A0A0G0WUC7_9BACT|nr:MAG: hypothetical protein UU24_C0019G0008 [Candidatus Nomurabacteria bacterium GW2011_GWA2_40_9]